MTRPADAFYLRMDRSVLVVESDEIDPGLIVDFGPNGNVVAIELLDAAARLGTPAARPPSGTTVTPTSSTFASTTGCRPPTAT
ncbi:MAG: DUF2283 domain-containing protein [Anaerolineae bacterium]